MIPVFGDDWKVWARQLTTALKSMPLQLRRRTTDSSAAEDGLVMWDATLKTPVVSQDGVWMPIGGPVAYARISGSNYVLTSTTSPQRLFNVSTNGALTLPTGRYYFRLMLRLSAMSATSGNGQFRLVGAGTATVASVFYHVVGVDNTSPLNALARNGSFSATQESLANMVAAGTGTGLAADITGHFIVESAGTIIPSIALTTAAAANVVVGTWMGVWRLSDASANTVGTWT